MQLEDWHSEECKLTPTYNTNFYTKITKYKQTVTIAIYCQAAPSGERACSLLVAVTIPTLRLLSCDFDV